MNSRNLCALILTGLFLTASTAPAQNPPSADAIRVMVGAGDYRNALNAINKLLFPSVPDPATRYQLLMLKGECQLQLKDRVGASTTFKSAGKCAANVNDLAAARANALIIDRSVGGQFTPRVGLGSGPIDILPMDSRKQAMTLLQREISGQNNAQIKAALSSNQLPPIEKVFTPISDMFFLETFSTGQPTDTHELMTELGSHAYQLIHDEVSKSAGRIDYLTQLANSASENSRGWNTGRLGLTSLQRDEVKTMFTYLVKIRDRATEYRGIAARLGGNEAKWDALVADTVSAISDAESLYNDR